MTERPSKNITFCLVLIYYFALCDFFLKFLPLGAAVVLRYAPEAALYAFALKLALKEWRRTSFPLMRPLLVCAVTMAISVVLNSSSKLAALLDYRLLFRFVAFAYIGWRTQVTPQRINQFLSGFLGLAVIQLVVGALEFGGGEPIQRFFSPVLGLTSGAAGISANQIFGQHGYISGTLSNYNFFGMFMTTSCILAIAMHLVRRTPRAVLLAVACAFGVVLSFSRHSLLMLFVGVACVLAARSQGSRARRAAKVAIALIVVVVLVGAAAQFVPGVQERLATVTTPEVLEGDPAENIRLYLTIELPPRFLDHAPWFGQGPIDPADAVQFGDEDGSWGPPLQAAPDVPGIATFYLGDVVWVMIMGLYGCSGLIAIGYVLWTIGASANKVRRQRGRLEDVALAQACLAMIGVFVVAGFFSQEIVARECIPIFWLLCGMVLSSETGLCAADAGAQRA